MGSSVRCAALLACMLAAGLAAAEEGAAPAAKEPIVETGEIAGAEFEIAIPSDWNRGLIMYAHGYETVGPKRRDFNKRIVEAAQRLGYAVAQSKYSAQGWCAREGILDTEALRRHFAAKYGKTFPTIIAGDSQGGAITFRTIELYPEAYDGACPMCAVGEPALKFFKERVFDMRILFDYYFPGLPGSVVDFPDGEKTMVNVALKAGQLIQADPAKAERFVRQVNLPDVKQIAPVIAFWSEILRELQARTGGNAFDNRTTIYAGSDDDAKLNREIPRHAADEKSVEYLRQWVTPTGEIHDPVIHMHTLVDQLIPTDATQYYEQLTRTAGTTDLFAQLWSPRVGHCNFTVDEIAAALRKLETWIKEGKRPESGEAVPPGAN